MLAITNILLLRGKMALPDGCEIVSSEQLLENLGKRVSKVILALRSVLDCRFETWAYVFSSQVEVSILKSNPTSFDNDFQFFRNKFRIIK